MENKDKSQVEILGTDPVMNYGSVVATGERDRRDVKVIVEEKYQGAVLCADGAVEGENTVDNTRSEEKDQGLVLNADVAVEGEATINNSISKVKFVDSSSMAEEAWRWSSCT